MCIFDRYLQGIRRTKACYHCHVIINELMVYVYYYKNWVYERNMIIYFRWCHFLQPVIHLCLTLSLDRIIKMLWIQQVIKPGLRVRLFIKILLLYKIKPNPHNSVPPNRRSLLLAIILISDMNPEFWLMPCRQGEQSTVSSFVSRSVNPEVYSK